MDFSSWSRETRMKLIIFSIIIIKPTFSSEPLGFWIMLLWGEEHPNLSVCSFCAVVGFPLPVEQLYDSVYSNITVLLCGCIDLTTYTI